MYSLDQVIEALACKKPQTGREIFNKTTGISHRAAMDQLRNMVNYGLVEAKGSRHDRVYLLVSDEPVYSTCIQCDLKTAVWNLQNHSCHRCRNLKKSPRIKKEYFESKLAKENISSAKALRRYSNAADAMYVLDDIMAINFHKLLRGKTIGQLGA